MPVLPFLPLIIGAAGAGLSGLGSTKSKTGTSGSTFQDTSTTGGDRTKRQSKLFKEALDQLFATISAGPTVLQSDRDRMRASTNSSFNALAPRLEAGLTARGFGSSGKLGAGFKGLDIARANQIQAGEAGLRTDAQNRYAQMLALASQFTRPDSFTTTRSGSSTGSQTVPGQNPFEAIGGGLGDLLGIIEMFGNPFARNSPLPPATPDRSGLPRFP